MDKIYLALSTHKTGAETPKYYPQSQIFTDEITLARYVKEQWDCYIFTGLQKVESVETTVIVEDGK